MKKKYFLIGIKGAGMSALAQILSDLGNEVSGYDDDRNKKYDDIDLAKRNIKVYHDQNHSLDKDTIVSYSKAFKPDHPEMLKVKKEGLTIVSYNDLVGSLTRQFETVCISGTHGKTMTTMLTVALLGGEDKVNYLVGDGSGSAKIDNEVFVLESDEFNKHFLKYSPHIAIILNIDLDHTECYPGGIDETKNTFKEFANKANIIVAFSDSENVKSIKFNKEPVYYGTNTTDEIRATNIEFTKEGMTFDLYLGDTLIDNMFLPLYGEYQVLNCLAAIYVALYYNVPLATIKTRLKEFTPPRRRFNISNYGDTVIIDDYAHHPKQIKTTLDTARRLYPDKQIVAVFLPDNYRRLNDFTDIFIDSLKLADKAFILDVRSTRDKQEDYPNVSSKTLIDAVENSEGIEIDDPTKLMEYKGSCFVFMSGSSIYILEDLFKEALENDL